METWSAYVRRTSGGLTQVQIAEKTGLAQTNVGRWLRGDPGLPKADSVIHFAKSFGQPAVEALIAAGYLDVDDAAATVRVPLSEYSTSEIFDEARRRARE